RVDELLGDWLVGLGHTLGEGLHGLDHQPREVVRVGDPTPCGAEIEDDLIQSSTVRTLHDLLRPAVVEERLVRVQIRVDNDGLAHGRRPPLSFVTARQFTRGAAWVHKYRWTGVVRVRANRPRGAGFCEPVCPVESLFGAGSGWSALA